MSSSITSISDVSGLGHKRWWSQSAQLYQVNEEDSRGGQQAGSQESRRNQTLPSEQGDCRWRSFLLPLIFWHSLDFLPQTRIAFIFENNKIADIFKSRGSMRHSYNPLPFQKLSNLTRQKPTQGNGSRGESLGLKLPTTSLVVQRELNCEDRPDSKHSSLSQNSAKRK